MMALKYRIFALLLVAAGISIAQEEDDFLYGYFPSDFEWGFATASYQIEGGWNEDGKVLFLITTLYHFREDF